MAGSTAVSKADQLDSKKAHDTTSPTTLCPKCGCLPGSEVTQTAGKIEPVAARYLILCVGNVFIVFASQGQSIQLYCGVCFNTLTKCLAVQRVGTMQCS